MNIRIKTKLLIVKRPVIINGRSTSVSVEEPFWRGLKEIAETRHMTPGQLVSANEAQCLDGSNLSSAVRVHVLTSYKDRGPAVAAAMPDQTRYPQRDAGVLT